MPITQETITRVSCDNPKCPGNKLPENELTGWTMVSGEVYGEGTSGSMVFCSTSCVSEYTGSLPTDKKLFEVDAPAVEPEAPAEVPV